MAVAYNNQKVVTDGLVLYYDMFNTQKSWKGKPTTNLFNNPSFASGDLTGWGTSANHGTYDLCELDSSIYRRDGHSGRVTVLDTTGSSAGHHYAFRRTPGVAHDGAVTVSVYIRGTPGTTNLLRITRVIGGSTYLWSGGSSGDVQHAQTANGEWQYFTATLDPWTGEGSTSHIHCRFGFTNPHQLSIGNVCYVDEAQLELGDFATPFVIGERTNTQSVLDLTGNHTFTANDLVYSAENTFSFTNNGNHLSTPFSPRFDFSKAQTICMWMKPTGAAARRNPYDQAYGGSGTITYETARTFNYYFGTHGGNSSPYVGRNSGFTVAADELAFVCVSRDQDLNQCDWYKNDTHKTSLDAGGYAATNNGSSQIRVGLGYTGNGGFIGDIYSLALFNRKLSDEEILSMFEMSRHRYGV